MSKASEWARQVRSVPQPPKHYVLGWGIYFEVDDEGRLAWAGSGHIPAESALELARWILDTFGEP